MPISEPIFQFCKLTDEGEMTPEPVNAFLQYGNLRFTILRIENGEMGSVGTYEVNTTGRFGYWDALFQGLCRYCCVSYDSPPFDYLSECFMNKMLVRYNHRIFDFRYFYLKAPRESDDFIIFKLAGLGACMYYVSRNYESVQEWLHNYLESISVSDLQAYLGDYNRASTYFPSIKMSIRWRE